MVSDQDMEELQRWVKQHNATALYIAVMTTIIMIILLFNTVSDRID